MAERTSWASTRPWVALVAGVGILSSGVTGLMRAGGGEGGWFLDSVWIVVGLCAVVPNAATLLERRRQHASASTNLVEVRDRRFEGGR